MTISFETLKRFYLFTAVFYYFGFMNFLDRMLKGGKADDLMNANAAGTASKQIIGVLLLLLGVVILLKLNKHMLFSMLRASYWWVVLIGFFLASVIWSYEPGISLRRLIAFSTLVVVAFCLVCSFESESLFYFLVKSIVLAALIGLVLVVVAPHIALGGEGERAGTFIGIMGDKNGGARLYAYALLILVGLGKYSQAKHKLMLATLFLCIVLAKSATAIVMVVAGTGLIVLFKSLHTYSPAKNLKRFLFITILISVAATCTYYLYGFLLELLGRDPTLTNRTLIWQLLMISVENEPWLGYGFGAFWSSDAVLGFVERWGFIGNAHSGYFEVLLNGGRVGLAIVILLILKILKDLVRNYITQGSGNLLAALIAIILLQCVVNAVGYIVTNHNSADMLIFTVIAFVASYWLVTSRPGNNPMGKGEYD